MRLAHTTSEPEILIQQTGPSGGRCPAAGDRLLYLVYKDDDSLPTGYLEINDWSQSYSVVVMVVIDRVPSFFHTCTSLTLQGCRSGAVR